MKGFVQGVDCQQTTLLPECLDDWVGESNPIRAVDVFVPMLKLYLYGYLNRVQSSRRLGSG
jgi:transposase